MTVLPPIPVAEVSQPMPECWRVIGVSGDRTCPELENFIHCRNCPVLAEAARSFFDRAAPEGYLEAWREILAEPETAVEADSVSLLVFRVAKEWLALPAPVLVEVTPVRQLHALPHRRGTPLAGLVNIRGQLRLCVSLHAILGLPGGPAQPGALPAGGEWGESVPRLLVLERTQDRTTDLWVIGADDVASVHRVHRSALRPVPATVSQSSARCSAALFDWQEKTVAVLDDGRLFEALRQAVAS